MVFFRNRKRITGRRLSAIKRTTIVDIARAANVSISTVSRVLNGKAVKKSTQARVEEAIQQLDFSPDPSARAMISKETRTIGMLVPNLSNEFWGAISDQIQDELWQNGYSLILCSFNYEMEREIAFLKMLAERKVDGIILGTSTPTVGNGDYSHIAQLRTKYRIPLVSLDQNIPDMRVVTGDTIQSAMNAVDHLIHLDNRNIAYIGGPAVSIDREFGYRKAIMRNGLTVNERLVILGKGQSFDFGYEAMKELLERKEPFGAVFCGNDLIAMGAMHALHESGIRVPEDVGIVGYDDIHLAAMWKPALTTVRQPTRQISKELIQLLLSAIEHEDEMDVPKKIMVPNELVVRESCGSKLALKR